MKSASITICVSEPTNMLDVRAILWLENYLQVAATVLLALLVLAA